jgi:predicted RNA polymerase sigma factor
VPSEYIDRQVLKWLQEQIFANREMVTEGLMAMLGKDDLFTKAMIDASIENIDQVIEQGLPDDVRTWLGMFGFRIVVDIHGDVMRVELPSQEAPEE